MHLLKPVHPVAMSVRQWFLVSEYSETMVLRGLDSFLREVKRVIQTEEERDTEELPHVVLS